MIDAVRRWIIHALWTKRSTSLMVGSHITYDGTYDGERAIAIRLCDGWKETTARLSPEGARACARQLNEWADWAERGRSIEQWQAIIRSTVKAAEVGESLKP